MKLLLITIILGTTLYLIPWTATVHGTTDTYYCSAWERGEYQVVGATKEMMEDYCKKHHG